MLWPFGKWSFASSAARLIATYVEPTDNQPPVALAGIHRDLALHMDDSFENNRGKLRWVYLAFRLGALLLAGEVIAWVIALVHHG